MRALNELELRQAESGDRFAFIFANCHLLVPAVRAWVLRTLWPLMQDCGIESFPLIIFAGEGHDSMFPAHDRESSILLGDFTAEDVAHFLRTQTSLAEPEVQDLVLRIHSREGPQLLSTPKSVYSNLKAEAVRLGLESILKHAGNV